MIILFKDLVFKPHMLGRGAIHAKMDLPNDKWVSVVGGGVGLYGDGVNTFEVMTSDNTYDVFSYLTKEEVDNVLVALQLGDNNLFPKFKLKKHKLT